MTGQFYRRIDARTTRAGHFRAMLAQEPVADVVRPASDASSNLSGAGGSHADGGRRHASNTSDCGSSESRT